MRLSRSSGREDGREQNITAIKEAERTQAQLAAIVNSADDAIISQDLVGTITSWDRGAEQMFGYTAEEAVGQSHAILVPAEGSAERATILERIRQGEYIRRFETQRVRKDGVTLDVSLSVSPIYDRNSQVVGAAIIEHDISERKRADEQLRLRRFAPS